MTTAPLFQLTTHPEIISEAMSLLLTHDDGTPDELETLISRYRDLTNRQVEHYRSTVPIQSPLSSRDLQRFLLAAIPNVLFRRRYEHMAAAAGNGSPPIPQGDEIRDLATLFAGEQADGALTALKADVRARLVEELAGIEAKLDRFRSHPATVRGAMFAPSPGQPGWSSWVDVRLRQVAPLLVERDDLAERIERLAPDAPEPRQAAGSFVARALKSAGGREAIAGRIAEARRLRGVHLAGDPNRPEMEDLQRSIENLDRDIASLGHDADNPPAGSHGAELIAMRKNTLDRINTIKAAVIARQAADIKGLIDLALSGNESAREAIIMQVRAYPIAFPSGFAESLQWHGTASDQLNGLADELLRQRVATSTGIHLPDSIV